MTVHENYDTPSEDDVRQDPDPESLAVPVEVRNVVRTEELPTRTFYRNIILSTGSGSQKVLNGDPHRKRLVLWIAPLAAGAEGVCIAGTQGDAEACSGAIVMGATPFEFTDKGEVWAKPLVINDNAGTWTGYAVSTDDVILSVAVEQWAN